MENKYVKYNKTKLHNLFHKYFIPKNHILSV